MTIDVPTNRVSQFIGTWRNTNPSSAGIAVATFNGNGDCFALRMHAAAPDYEFHTIVEIFVGRDSGTAPEKILGRHPMDSADMVFHGWIKQGVLVLAIFRMTERDGVRTCYFDREFFYRDDERR